MAWKNILWRQFGAAIDMLDDALRACPDELWQKRIHNDSAVPSEFAQYWYVGYHALFWLDFYLSETSEGFAPPAPFTLAELEPGAFPERVYTKAELQTYLAHCRQKYRAKLEALTDELAPQRCRLDWPEMTVAELLLYNMRNVQEHAAQLSLYLGQNMDSAPGWVGKVRGKGIDT